MNNADILEESGAFSPDDCTNAPIGIYASFLSIDDNEYAIYGEWISFLYNIPLIGYIYPPVDGYNNLKQNIS